MTNVQSGIKEIKEFVSSWFSNLMDPEAFSNLYKWDARAGAGMPVQSHRLFEAIAPPPPPPPAQAFPPYSIRAREVVGGGVGLDALVDFFQPYGIRYPTIAKLNESGFTVSTLLGMRDEELDEIMIRLSQIFHCDLLIGEQYGVKVAVRSERRRHLNLLGHNDNAANPLDALSQGGLSEEPVQQQREAAGSGGGATWDLATTTTTQNRKIKKKKMRGQQSMSADDDEVNCKENGGSRGRGRCGRQREHPFIVTEPGEVARGKKNGLDYLFHLYEQCREFLAQVQNIAKAKGEKCPAKVTNQVYRYATDAGARYINKPKMRHYVHCYAFHCLDEKASNALRKACKERQENIGAWRDACYEPLVALAGQHGWDIDGIFSAHPRLSIWYVPTRLRKLCHAQCSTVASADSA